MIQGLTRREREITDIEEIIKILEKENAELTGIENAEFICGDASAAPKN